MVEVFFRLLGCYGSPKMNRVFRFHIRNRAAFKRSMEPLLSLGIRKILPSHGKVISHDANGALYRIFESLG